LDPQTSWYMTLFSTIHTDSREHACANIVSFADHAGRLVALPSNHPTSYAVMDHIATLSESRPRRSEVRGNHAVQHGLVNGYDCHDLRNDSNWSRTRQTSRSREKCSRAIRYKYLVIPLPFCAHHHFFITSINPPANQILHNNSSSISPRL